MKRVMKDRNPWMIGRHWRPNPVEAIVTLGAKAGMTEEEIIKQGQMARILRFEEYNFIDKEIYLWSPEQLRS